MVEVSTGTLTVTIVIIIWTAIQTFALEYLWFVEDKFQKLDEKKKKTVNAVGILIIVVFAYVMALLKVFDTFTPDLAGAMTAIGVYFGALGIGQGVHRATKRSKPRP